MFVEYDFVDGDELEKRLDELNNYRGDLPWVILEYIDSINYLNEVSEDIKANFFNRRHDIMVVNDIMGYLQYDLEEWIKENPEYKNIIKEVKN